jgi:hypothetical protein
MITVERRKVSRTEIRVMLDAALMHAHPDCDSIAEGVHIDTKRAFDGGPAAAREPQP